jgi:hypothetical protein
MPPLRPVASLIASLRHAAWLDRERVIAWGRVLLVLELLMLGFLALWQHGMFVAIENPTSSDFVSFYAAGKLALAGTPALAYDQAAHYLAEQQASVAGAPYQFFFYPPVFLALCAALACLPYFVAFCLFQFVTLGLFILVMRCVLRESGWTWLPPLLAFPAVFWTLGLGQNAFLTAALFGGFTLLVDRRPVMAGLLLGLLCYKPHFGLLAPVALAAGGRWRSFATAAATVGALVGLSILLFGWDTWRAYLAAFSTSNAVYESGRIDYAGMISLFGAVRLLGFEPGLAYGTQAAAGVLMAGLTALIWRRGMSQPLRAGTLLTATLLAVPLALLYDKLLALVAIGWLVRDARRNGFLPWDKLALLVTYPLSLLTWPLGTAWHLPLGPLVSAIILALCLRRVWRALPAPAPAIVAQAAGATP